jgi:signal transduction histidine kinase
MLDRRSLRGRVTPWMFVATSLTLLIFSIAAYLVVLITEVAEHEDPAVASAESQRQVLTSLAFAAPIGLVLSTVGALWLSRRALAPFDRVIAAAREITVHNLDRRIAVPERADELRALAVALNELLDRVERGHRALAMFAADASHELRTPIAAICSELEVALRRPRSAEDWARSATTALDELRRLARVMDALLRFAQADAAPTIRSGEVELAGLVDEVAAIHAQAARTAGVQLVLRCDDDLHVRGDPDMLSTAISNLISNAIRYTPASGSITASVETADHAACVHVDDTGPGLELGEVESIFTPFARGAQGRSADRDGLGLGLPIARRIVERHGGTIAASQRATGGARFTIRLPLLATTSALEPAAQREHHQDDHDDRRGRPAAVAITRVAETTANECKEQEDNE